VFFIGYSFLLWGLIAVGIQGELQNNNSALLLGIAILVVAFILRKKEKTENGVKDDDIKYKFD